MICTEKNILISGTMRSGTTLMGATLDAHPQISIVNDIINWFWSRFYPVYGDITTEFELDKALFELELFICYGLNPKQLEKFQKGEIKQDVIEKGNISSLSFYLSIIKLFYYDKLSENIGIKATHHANYYANYLETVPKSFVIHMTRDVLDIFNSHKKRVANGAQKSIIANTKKKIIKAKVNTGLLLSGEFYYNVGKRAYTSLVYEEPIKMFDEWSLQNKKAIELQKKYPDRIKIVKYEDFVINPENKLKEILDFLSIGWLDNFYAYENLKDRNGNPYRANTTSLKKANKGFSAKSIGQGIKHLSSEEKAYFERVARDTYKQLAY